ncbi:chromosome segregation and condensation protein ScpA [Gemmatirosa kalamazoonensis]|uniref:Segregation and condensation protein A n=1 Tax=Gemmatirosa kalamazoonensis TaxID=861299 RepID=W0RHX6_9BACT|nr:ScpA family protein [Gemmatirosa kalamazoonensis]AHG90684.1 chromosome segregation and condensation protein ScpA [Gemmatirosa kalamazoonensis]
MSDDERLTWGDAPVVEPRDAQPQQVVPGTGAFVVELAQFSGPLDLLLSLIRDEQLDVYDIPIARVAQQFLARVKELGLDEAADYLEMAARLLRIKAQLLLPRSGDEEAWEDPRAELVRRLLEYQQVREVVEHLDRLGEDRRQRFTRGWNPALAAMLPTGAPPLALSLSELLSAVDRVLRTAKEPTIHDVVPRALDVASAIVTVRSVLALRRRARWTDVVGADAEPWQILSVLLALLEMAKLGELRLEQSRPFAVVEIASDVAGEAA